MAISLEDAWDISGIRLPGQSVLALILSPMTVPKVSAYGPDHLFQTAFGKVTPVDRVYLKLTGQSTDNGIGKWSQARLSLLGDIDSSTRGFCVILCKDLAAQAKNLSFKYGRPAESWSSLAQMYFGKRRASRINLFWSC